MVTATDFFCGAGGSSTGMVEAGIEVKLAANHWQLAIETHNTNHPQTDHDLADLMATHPSRYPRTDMAWFSPECTNHSLAKGKKRKSAHQLDLWGEQKVDPAEERSRATMREVVEFAEYHRYEIVIVENVVDIRYWQYYEDWLRAMVNLGYDYRTLYLNAMFFDVPQSRDRWYTVFWKKGSKAPDLEFRPPAVCEKHGEINAVQAWKKPDYPWGRYGKRRQYVYRCPQCGQEVHPQTIPAAAVIDWSLPAPRIGDRERPLAPKTIERIKAGLRKFSQQVVIMDMLPSHAAHNGKVFSIGQSLPTQTTRQSLSLITPFLTSYYSREDAQSSVDEPMPTLTVEPRHALVTPPFFVETGGIWERGERSVNEPLSTLMTRQTLPLITPPFITPLRGTAVSTGVDEPLSTIVAAGQQHALIMSYYGSNSVFKSTHEPMPTQRTVGHQALIQPEDLLEECGFRMLEPHELKLGMSFPYEYVVLGNKRDQVKQVGNAVAVKVAAWITRQCREALL